MQEPKFVVYVVLGIYPCFTGGMEIFYSKLIPEIGRKENIILITNCSRYKTENYRTFIIPKRFLNIPFSGKFATVFYTALAILKIHKQIKLIHLPYTSDSGRWGYIFPLLKKYFKIKYLLHLHGGGMKKWRKWSFERSLFKNAFKIIAVSKTIKAEYEKRIGRIIDIVLPLVPFEEISETKNELRQRLNFNSHDRIILFVGSLKQLKDPGVLLDAFLHIEESYLQKHNLKLIFVGEGIQKKNLEEKAKANGKIKHIFFTGRIPYRDVPKYYKIADIYVISSHFEGTPKSLLEAMFHKLPIIGTNVNGINTILTNEKNALLFNKESTNQLCAHIKRLVDDSDFGRNIGEQAFIDYSQSYLYTKTIDQLLTIYNE